MNNDQAKALAHEFLCRRIEITHCPELPENVNFYDFNPVTEYLFTFKLLGHGSVGAAEYIAVDRETREVRYLGFHGE
ncbi:MAG: hypothetical protein RPU12_11580 [Candidatus Sedimenticola sp. (ex Thyasira tokunagai)]